MHEILIRDPQTKIILAQITKDQTILAYEALMLVSCLRYSGLKLGTTVTTALVKGFTMKPENPMNMNQIARAIELCYIYTTGIEPEIIKEEKEKKPTIKPVEGEEIEEEEKPEWGTAELYVLKTKINKGEEDNEKT